MKFQDYLNEEKFGAPYNDTFTTQMLSKEVGMPVYIIDGDIYIKNKDIMAISHYIEYSQAEITQILKDFIAKNFNEEYDILERIPLLQYMVDHDKDTDLYIRKFSRCYAHKPLICTVADVNNHNYIIGYHASNINKAAEYIGLPKEGYSLYVLDGKFEAVRATLHNGVTAYVISPYYDIRKSDGNTEVTIAGQVYNVKHIRRKL